MSAQKNQETNNRLAAAKAAAAPTMQTRIVCIWVRTPAWWCRHSAGHGAMIPAPWCTLSAEDGAFVPFPVVHGGRRRWCTAAMLGLSL